MSNYADINSAFTLSSHVKPEETQSNPVSKNKFVTKDKPDTWSHGHWVLPEKKPNVVDNETILITPGITKREKIQMKLNDEFQPNDFSVRYTNSLKTEQCNPREGFYYTNKDVGAGRGFGNLEISNDIRYGDASRHDTKEFKEVREGQQFFDYQFQYLDRNFQDPSHIVMPIPRGGESTRKQNQLTVNTMREDSSDFEARTKTIKFNY
jgi:hypothetical protein